MVASLNRYAPMSNGGFEKLEGNVHFKDRRRRVWMQPRAGAHCASYCFDNDPGNLFNKGELYGTQHAMHES